MHTNTNIYRPIQLTSLHPVMINIIFHCLQVASLHPAMVHCICIIHNNNIVLCVLIWYLDDVDVAVWSIRCRWLCEISSWCLPIDQIFQGVCSIVYMTYLCSCYLLLWYGTISYRIVSLGSQPASQSSYVNLVVFSILHLNIDISACVYMISRWCWC